MTSDGPDVTSLFARMRHGDPETVKGVWGELDAELRRLSVCQMRGERCWLKTRLQSSPRV